MQLYPSIQRSKKEGVTSFFIYVWTIYEDQVKDKYASQKFKAFSGRRRPETHFRHAQGHQRASA